MDHYAVFGNPIKHSKSPLIHRAFAEQTGEPVSYRSVLVEEGHFADAAASFFAHGGLGLNITVPFKVDAFRFADQLSDRARRAGAVNTLARQDDGRIYGDNTDGVGLVRDICENLGWELRDRHILILGAGGAVRGILEPLLRKHPAQLLIANRTVAKAQQLAADFADLGRLGACRFEALEGNQFDLIINATSASLAGELPPLPTQLLGDEGLCYDLMYAPRPTPFMRWGASNAAWAVSDGLGMLVEQAAESFCIWRGQRPRTKPVIDLVRATLQREAEEG